MTDLIKRGSVYWVNLPSPKSRTHELEGSHPAIIFSNNQQNLVSPVITIIPLTSKIDKIYPFEVLTNLNNQPGKALVDQITTIDKTRLGNKLGELDSLVMKQITKALHLTLALEE